MNTPIKLGGYVAVLLAVFGAAAAVGAAVGPVGSVDEAPHGASGAAPHDGSPEERTVDDKSQNAVAAPSATGLEISQKGYTLALSDQLPAGSAVPVSFRIIGPDARPVTSFDTSQGKDLHLIAVRRDFAGYQHVHPTLAGDGTWSVPLSLTPGTWRLFADFDPAGADADLVLGADVAVAGDYQPQPVPAPSSVARVGDYTVTLAGGITSGDESALTLSVTRAGQPVADLQPYLAAYGHLVALRDGDLAYLHVHPAGEPGDGTTKPGPDVTFYATAPSAGEYRLFFDFQHGDVVRTAEFTVAAGRAADSMDADDAAHPMMAEDTSKEED